jgi:hypothetical protein
VGTTCAVTVAAPPVSPVAGGPVALAVKTGQACAWAAESLPNWISVAGDPFGSGPASLTLTLAPNADAPHSATVVIGGQNIVIGQAGTMTIVGQVTLSGNPLPGVTISLSDGETALTDSGGFFTFSGLDSTASYVVTPTLDGYTFSPASQTFTNMTANPTANFTAKESSQ